MESIQDQVKTDSEMDGEQLLTDVRVNGFCVIEGVIPSARCTDVRESVLAAAKRGTKDYDPPTNVDFVPGFLNRAHSFAPYLAHETLIAVAERLLGPHLRISFTSAIVNLGGNDRGDWHSDWPFNQRNAGHVPAPYPDVVMHLTTLWMISPFTEENGGTLVVPGSHRSPTNPTGENEIDPKAPFPGEMRVRGEAGSVLLMDSRLWHATSPNKTTEPRAALAVRYAPWWLNVEVLRPESPERDYLLSASGKSDNQVPSLKHSVYDRLPENVKTLYRHWVVD